LAIETVVVGMTKESEICYLCMAEEHNLAPRILFVQFRHGIKFFFMLKYTISGHMVQKMAAK